MGRMRLLVGNMVEQAKGTLFSPVFWPRTGAESALPSLAQELVSTFALPSGFLHA